MGFEGFPYLFGGIPARGADFPAIAHYLKGPVTEDIMLFGGGIWGGLYLAFYEMLHGIRTISTLCPALEAF